MGKKLDALLGRTFKTKKFKALLNLALTRLSILKNQRQVRCSHATSDVTELLKLGQHENAYHRVDQVIKDQSTLDVLFFIHGYFTLLLDRVHLFEHNRDCPDELLEAVSSLLFAASRIGEFPELQEIRNVLVSRFGKDIAARSIELRSNCGVNPKVSNFDSFNLIVYSIRYIDISKYRTKHLLNLLYSCFFLVLLL